MVFVCELGAVDSAILPVVFEAPDALFIEFDSAPTGLLTPNQPSVQSHKEDEQGDRNKHPLPTPGLAYQGRPRDYQGANGHTESSID